MRVAKTIELDGQTDRELRALSQRKRIEVRLQQRARIVLLAAGGMQNKDIAVVVGLDRRQVALWRARFLEGGIAALRKDAPRSGRPASGVGDGVAHRACHAAREAGQRHALEHAHAGRAPGRRCDDHAPRLARQRPEAAPEPYLQGLERSALRGKVAGRGGPVPESARARPGAELRREEPDPGAGPHAAGPADEGRARRHHDPRLQAPRHDDAVRGAEHAGRPRDLDVPAAAPARSG